MNARSQTTNMEGLDAVIAANVEQIRRARA